MSEPGRISEKEGESILYRFLSVSRGPARSSLPRATQIRGGNHVDGLIVAICCEKAKLRLRLETCIRECESVCAELNSADQLYRSEPNLF